jgi:hypothetical protein
VLQSGSFFRQRWDRQESGLPRFRRIARFVGAVLNGGPAATPIPITLTCGAPEENLANNRAVATACAARATRPPCTSTATPTTTWAGATRSTRTRGRVEPQPVSLARVGERSAGARYDA